MANLVKDESEGLLRETLKEGDFQKLQAFAKEHWGFDLHPSKKTLVANRLLAFCRKVGRASFSEVLQTLFARGDRDLEIQIFDNLSTNLTSFFRDRDQFRFFQKEILEPFKGSDSSLKLWSAGCSAGCEPYSLAICAKETLPQAQLRKVEILGTDYSVSALKQAKSAVFPLETAKEVDETLLHRHFLKGVGKASGNIKLRNEVKKLVRFHLLNLMEAWPSFGPFDAIFCRNVMIYFGEEVQTSLIQRFSERLKPGGFLFVGSAESFSRIASGFLSAGPSIFRKAGGQA
ncbi:MAG TPA: protein-glutamate O-methyltransferase CheR [Planctomycetes bacterium]|nr:protein-glutamate O-methyltransferase CheR [Planctomycetota bacterium]